MATMGNPQEQARKLKDSASAALIAGKLESALASFRQAVQLVPQDIAARKKVAEIFVRLNRRGEAITEYQHLVGHYVADGQLVQAMAICKVILQLDPSHTSTQDVLANLCAKKGETRHWIEKLPSNMAGALDVRHLPARPPASAAPPELPLPEGASPLIEVGAPVEIDVGRIPPTPLFSDLPKAAFLTVLDQVTLRTVPGGERIISEGEKGTSMFILVQGSVEVVRALPGEKPRTVARMGEGTFFGEMGLLSDAPRLASVVASQECVLLELTREMIHTLTSRFPEVESVLQKFYRERLLANLLRSNPLFQPFSAKQKQAIVDRFVSRRVEPGTVLVRQGQPGEALGLLLRGSCEVVHEEPGAGEKRYPELREGAVFGEISLLLNSGATATVRAKTPCVVLELDKKSFSELILSHPEVRKMITRLSKERLQRTAELISEEKVEDAFLL